ncbi:MAG: heme ABC transporter substrate-binding protein IsdE [Paraclostridium sp.]
MKLKINVVSLIGLLTVFLMVGCSASNIDKQDKNETKFNEGIVVATSVAVTQILDELGVKVSGVPTTSYDLPENTKGAIEVGNPMSPDLEIIKSLNPDLVVSVDTLGKDYEEMFIKNNINSKFVNLSNINGLKESINSLGQEFNKMENANKILKELDDKESELKLKSSNNKDKVMIVFGAPGSIMIGTDRSYVGDLVEIAGGNNIFKGSNSSFIPVNIEEIIKENPDKILVMTHAVPEEAEKMVKDEFRKNTSWNNVNAIKNNKVYYLENEYFGMSANLKAIDALDKLGDILYE